MMSDLDDFFMLNSWFKYEEFKKIVKISKSAKIKL